MTDAWLAKESKYYRDVCRAIVREGRSKVSADALRTMRRYRHILILARRGLQ